MSRGFPRWLKASPGDHLPRPLSPEAMMAELQADRRKGDKALPPVAAPMGPGRRAQSASAGA